MKITIAQVPSICLIFLISFFFIVGCSQDSDNKLPDCGVGEEKLNNQLLIMPVQSTYVLHQSIVVKLKNMTSGVLASQLNDFDILIYKKSKDLGEWIAIDNKSTSSSFDRRFIENNTSAYFGFFPNLIAEEKTTEIYVCIYAFIVETQELVGASANFILK